MNPVYEAIKAWEADIKAAHAEARRSRAGVPYRELLRETNYIKRRAKQGRLEALDVLRTAREVRKQAEDEHVFSEDERAQRLNFIADMLLNLADVISKVERDLKPVSE